MLLEMLIAQLRSFHHAEKNIRKNWIAQCTTVAVTAWNLKYALGNLEKEFPLQAMNYSVGTTKGEERCWSSG